MDNDHVGIPQSILPQSAQTGAKFWLGIDERFSCRFGNLEGVFDSSNEFIMVDISGSHEVDVVPHIVFVVVLLDHVSADGLHVLDVAQDWQSDLLLFVDASV